MREILIRYKHYITVLAFTVIGHLLGFGRELASAYYLGASELADGLVVGLLPLVLFVSIFGTGYANAAMVQIRNLDNPTRVRQTLPPIIIVSIIASPLLYANSALIIDFLAPGLGPEGKRLAMPLAAAAGASLPFVIFAAWGKALLQLDGHFARASLADIAPNLGMIAGITLLFHVYGFTGLALGALGGYIVQWIISIKSIFFNIKLSDFFKLLSTDNLEIYRNTFLATLSYSVVYVELVVDRYFASLAGEGSIATMNYAQKIMVLPLHTLFLAIGTVIFPKLITAATQAGGLDRAANRLYRVTLTLAIPVTLGGVLLGPWAANLLLGYGKLAGDGATDVGVLLQIYMLAFIPLALAQVATKVRYAANDFKTPLIAGLSAAGIKLLGSVLLFQWLELPGLILATALAAATNCSILIYWRRGRADTE